MQNTFQLSDRVSAFWKKKKDVFLVKFLFEDSRLIHEFQVTERVFSILKLVNGKNTPEQIAEKIQIEFEIVEKTLKEFEKRGLITLKKQINYAGRYKRQINFFGSFEDRGLSRLEYQKKIEASSVCVIGLGGIGSWVVEYAARIGVGTICVIDSDFVEETNLTRQSLYVESDIGERKINAIAKKIKEINRKTKVIKIFESIETSSQLLKYIKDFSVVINAADYPDTDVTNLLVTEEGTASKA